MTHGDTPVRVLRVFTDENALLGNPLGVIDGDLDSIEYWFFSREDQVRIHKVVHFFLVRFVRGDTSQHDHEVAEASWFSVERALDRMTYPNERQIVRKATALLAEARGQRALDH